MEISKNKTVFVTVGSTQFPELVSAVITKKSLEILHSNGFTNLVIQYGAGPEPKISVENIKLRAFPLTTKFTEEVNKADLLICHCGAGTLLDALRAHKKAIGVINDTLMDNHQVQLANGLHKDGYIAIAPNPKNLIENVFFSMRIF